VNKKGLWDTAHVFLSCPVIFKKKYLPSAQQAREEGQQKPSLFPSLQRKQTNKNLSPTSSAEIAASYSSAKMAMTSSSAFDSQK
jgi:hypothetical protein